MFTERNRSTASEQTMKNFSTKLFKGKVLPILAVEEAVKPTSCCNSSTKANGKIFETRYLSAEDITATPNTLHLRSLENNVTQHKNKASIKNPCSKCEKCLCNCGLKWKEGATFFPDFFPQTFYDDSSIATDWFSLSDQSQQENLQTKRNPCQKILEQTDVKLISSWMKYFGQKDNSF